MDVYKSLAEGKSILFFNSLFKWILKLNHTAGSNAVTPSQRKNPVSWDLG